MSQTSTNLISQAGQMQLGIIPNDMIQFLNDISCILLGPFIQKILYPALRKHGFALKPIARMALSFIAMSAAMAYAAGLQKLIYSSGPCFAKPLACDASEGGSIPNDISVWVQIPVYPLLAFAEITGFATLSEYSYSQAPKDMRSLVQALRSVIAAIGAAIAMALSPVLRDPTILVMYASLAAIMLLTGPLFWVAFKDHDRRAVQLDIAIPENVEKAANT